MSLFFDDFIRSVCLAHAAGSLDPETAFQSGDAFAITLQRSLILCFQIFVAHKVHSLPQYSYLLSTPEFPVIESDSEPEEDDDDYMSDKDEDVSNDGNDSSSPLKKQESSVVGEGETELPEIDDPVLKLKENRHRRNRFYGTKVSFLSVEHEK